MTAQEAAEPQKCPECGVKLSLSHQFDMHMSSHHPAQSIRPTEAEIRKRIDTIRQYGEAGWLPSPEAGNYAINELHWALGEEMIDPPFPLPVVVSDSTNPTAITYSEAEFSKMMADRDEWYERLDKLIYSLATVEQIGEWSSANDPVAEFEQLIHDERASRPLSDSTALIEEILSRSEHLDIPLPDFLNDVADSDGEYDREDVAHFMWTYGARLDHPRCRYTPKHGNDADYSNQCAACQTYLEAVADSIIAALAALHPTSEGDN